MLLAPSTRRTSVYKYSTSREVKKQNHNLSRLTVKFVQFAKAIEQQLQIFSCLRQLDVSMNDNVKHLNKKYV